MLSKTRAIMIFGIIIFLLGSTISVNLTDNAKTNQTQDSMDGSTSDEFSASSVNLQTDSWKMNHLPNGDFEGWTNPHNPQYFTTTRTTERYVWYASSPYPVNESSRSLGMQVRAVDNAYPSEARLSPQNQVFWNNPTNLTMRFDYFLDAFMNPSTNSYFKLEITVKALSNIRLTYYLAGNTTLSNSTYYGYYVLDSPLSQWNRFDRNVTQDLIAATGNTPTQFNTFYFYLKTNESSYQRTFIDDFYLVNGTVRIGGSVNNGNFETSGTWYWLTNNDPGDIVQTSDRQNGDWAANMTVVSRGNISKATISQRAGVRLADQNPDRFMFYWKIDQWINPNQYSYAYLSVEMENQTSSFYLYYWFAYAGTPAPFSYSGYNHVQVDGFNTTGSWNLFDRSIWEDITSFNSTSEVFVRDIEFIVYADRYPSTVSLFVDDLKVEAAILNDMSYEDQGDVGDYVRSWGSWNIETANEFRVTDFAYTGSKAANLTMTPSTYVGFYRNLKAMPFNASTEVILDFNWYLDEFTSTGNDYIEFYFYFGTDVGIHYLIAAGPGASVSNTSTEKYIYIEGANMTGAWRNAELDLAADYLALFGTVPDTTISDISLIAEGDAGGRLELILDDLYLVEGTWPRVSGLTQLPALPETGMDVNISVSTYDKNLDSVLLRYRVDGSSWNSLPMSKEGASIFTATIPGQDWASLVEYYIYANDTYGHETLGMSGSEYYSFTVQDTIAPTMQVQGLTNESTVGGVVDMTVIPDDNSSGIQRVEISVDGTTVSNDTTSPYEYSWDTVSEDNGQHVIVIKAVDNAGNTYEMKYIVTVYNAETSTPTTPTTSTNTPEPPGSPDMLLIVVIGIAVVAGVVVILFVLLRQRTLSH